MAEADTAIIIIGAGVVGLSTALYLRRSGRDVVVIDPLPPPGGASFGNAGMISADTSVPIALPGMLRKVPSWLTDPLGPLAVRPSYFPKALPWLMKWIAASRMSRVLEISMRCAHCTKMRSCAGGSCCDHRGGLAVRPAMKSRPEHAG
jgi:glycine/D-amino acid oxidase-like deaminating enzyme